MTGFDKCPVKPWLGVRLSNVPIASLRDFLYNGALRTFHPDLIAYVRSKFSAEELLTIDNEIAETERVVEEGINLARSLIRPPRIPRVAPETVVEEKKQDLTPLVENHRSLEL